MDRVNLIEMFKRMATEIAEKDFSDVTETSVIADMGVDSLAMLEVVGEMERELEVQIPDDQLVGIETVAQLLDVVERRIKAA
ncbi:MAG: phosphopantetheine-binding protein [Myxococcota bacterium]